MLRWSGWMWMLTAMLGLALAPRMEASGEETPAEETVCDSLAGSEAWGLCNAYCEAMDCDSEAPKASDQACQHVLENFMAHAPGPIPCGLPPCPCYDEADLDELVAACASPGDELACDASSFGGFMVCNYPDAARYGAATAFAPNFLCLLRDSRDSDPDINLSNLTPDEVLACLARLEAKQSEGVCDVGP